MLLTLVGAREIVEPLHLVLPFFSLKASETRLGSIHT